MANYVSGSNKKKHLFVYLFQRKPLFSGVQKTKKMSEFTDCNVFFKVCDEKGSMTWALSDNKVSFLYCFNEENINLGQISGALNVIVINFGLPSNGCKVPFHMQQSNAESWSDDFAKRVEFFKEK